MWSGLSSKVDIGTLCLVLEVSRQRQCLIAALDVKFERFVSALQELPYLYTLKLGKCCVSCKYTYSSFTFDDILVNAIPISIGAPERTVFIGQRFASQFQFCRVSY